MSGKKSSSGISYGREEKDGLVTMTHGTYVTDISYGLKYQVMMATAKFSQEMTSKLLSIGCYHALHIIETYGSIVMYEIIMS